MKSRHLIHSNILAIGSAALFFSGAAAHADSTWSGSAANNWSVATNWSALPGSGDNIIIANTTTGSAMVLDDDSHIIGSLTFGVAPTPRTAAFALRTLAANTLTLNGGLTANGAFTGVGLTLNGNVTIAANQDWTIAGTVGSVTADAGVFIREATNSTGTSPSVSTLTLTENLTKKGVGQLVIAAANVAGPGHFIVEAGALKLNAGASLPLTVGGPGNITVRNAAQLFVSRNTGTMDISRELIMEGTSTLVLGGGGTTNSSTVASDIAWNGTANTLNLQNTGNSFVSSGSWTGASAVTKTGTGTVTLNGLNTSFSGSLTVSAGRVNLDSNLGGSVTLAAAGGLGGEGTVTSALTLNGGTIHVNPSTSASLGTLGGLSLTGTNTVNLTAPAAPGPVKILTYSTLAAGGATNLTLSGGMGSYRAGTEFTVGGGVVNLTLVTGDVTWTGAASSNWNTTENNWKEGISPTTFFNLDNVTFDETASANASFTTNLTASANNDLVFTAVASGAPGEAVSIEYVDPFFADSPLSVTVVGSAITVSLGTNSSNVLISTASDVKAAIEANGAASALVTVANAASNDGSGLVAALSTSSLAMKNPAIVIPTGVTVSPGKMTFDHSAIDYSIAGPGLIGGGGSLTKSGTDMLTITASNTFAGGTTLNAGRLRVGSATALGSGVITLAGGQLSSDSTTARTLANGLALSGSIILGDATNTGALTINGAATLLGNATIDVPTGTSIAHILGGALTDGAGSFSLIKEGSTGILVLNGANTYDGGTIINGGRVNAGSVTSFGTGTVTVADGAQAYIVGAGTCTNAFSIGGIGFSETAGNLGAIRLQGNTLSGPITLATDARITAYGSTGTLTGNIGETSPLTLLELSNYNTATDTTLTLSGANTYSGGTTVKGAIVVANSNTAFGTGAITIQSNGTAARTTRVQLGTNVTIDNDIIVNSNALTNFRGAVFSYAGDLSTPSVAVVNGDIEIQSAVGNGGHFGAEASSQSVLRIMGQINVLNNIIPLVRVGTVELGGGGDYTQLNHGEGILKLAAANGINPAAILNLSLSNPSTFDLNGWSQTLTGLTKGASNATVTNNGASPATLTLAPAAAATFGGTFADGTSALNLAKSGAGALTLTGASTSFTGGLSVTEGELSLTGTLGAAGATASVSAATLSGEGTFGGDLTLAGATLNVDGGTPLGVFVSGNLNTTGGVSVNLQSLPAAAGPIEIVSFGGALTGGAGSFTLAGASNYRSPVFSVAANAVNLTLGTPVDLTWTGTGGSNWDINTTSNWNNPSLTPSTFLFADNVTFGNTGGGTIAVPSTVNASNLIINSNDNWLFQGAGTVSANTLTKDGSGSATFECPVEFADLTLTNGVLRLSPPTGVTAAIPGIITGAGTLAKGGEGVLSIPSANTGFTGSMVISKGEVVPGNNNAFGTAKLVFGDATTLPADVCTLTLSTGIALATSQIEISDSCADARITGTGGAITGTTITKKGTGKLTIGHPTVYTTATNYITGSSSVIVEKGTLAFSSITAMATGTAITLGNANSGSDDTVFEIPSAATGDQEVLNAAFTLGTLAEGSASKAIVRYRAAGTVGGAPRINGTVSLNGRDLVLENTSLADNPSNSGLYNFAATISGTGNVRIRCGTNTDGSYNGTPRARLMGTANTWTGDLHVETGMLQVGNGNISTTFNAIPDTAVVYMSPGTRMGFGSSGDTFRGLAGGEAVGALPAAVVDDNTSGGGTITVTLASTADTENYVYGGTFSGGTRTMVLKKTGPGTQTFNGACSHTGATTISGGKLIANNTFASAITVAAGATLGGTMTSTNSITATAAAARIAPGNSTGTMSAASASLATGGILDLEIDDASTPKNDKLAVTGTLNVSSATLNLLPVGTPAEPVYVIASYGTLTGTFGTVTGKPSNYDLVYNYNDGVSSNNIALVKQGDAYQGWLDGYAALTGANRAPGVDFDGDGLDNGIEFVIGSDPTAFTGPGTAGFPAATVTGGNLVFTFKRSNASKSYAVTAETSTDLATWPPAKAYPIPTVDGTSGAVTVAGESVTVTIPMAPDAKKFARVKADIPFTP